MDLFFYDGLALGANFPSLGAKVPLILDGSSTIFGTQVAKWYNEAMILGVGVTQSINQAILGIGAAYKAWTFGADVGSLSP